MDEDVETAALEATAFERAKTIAINVLGKLGNPIEPAAYKPPFKVVLEIRRHFYEDEDGSMEDSIDEAFEGLKFALEWLNTVSPDVSHTVEDALEAFNVLDPISVIENQLDEALEILESLQKKRK